MSGGFLGRWSQRKRDVQAGRVPPEASQSESSVAQPAFVPAATASAGPSAPPAPAEPAAKTGLTSAKAQASLADGIQSEAVLPTLADAQQLTHASDFQPFMSQGVASEIRNAAMKKLFTDPHFNVMDGLDIYIGDYNTPDPLPPEMLRQMVGAQFLGLWDDEAAPGESAPAAAPLADALADIPTDTPTDAAHAAANPIEHDHTDLRLQPNPVAANPEPESGAG
jgi:hypothetical protein